MSAPVITTDRLSLRPWRKEDGPALFAILSDPVTMAAWPAPLDEAQFEAWATRALAGEAVPLPGRLVVTLKESGTIIGTAALMRLEVNGSEENDLGYIIHNPYWRKGYGFEAAYGLMECGHREFGLNRIVASMAADNEPSIAVAKKLQMKFELSFANPRNRDKTHLIFISETK